MTTIVDYGMGNLRNVARALRTLGDEVEVTPDPSRIRAAARLVLPGVGAFGEAVRRIETLKLRTVVLEHVAAGKPLLGICLGMQLLFESSEESPAAAGLGVIQGAVIRFPNGVKTPHIGWNDVTPTVASPLFDAGQPSRCFYFVHSYLVPSSPDGIATSDHGGTFVSAVHKGVVAGVQFHPEKSQDAGLEVLRRFLDMAAARSA